MVFKAQICNKKITVKSSQVEGGREGVKEVWTFSQVWPGFFCEGFPNASSDLILSWQLLRRHLSYEGLIKRKLSGDKAQELKREWQNSSKEKCENID